MLAEWVDGILEGSLEARRGQELEDGNAPVSLFLAQGRPRLPYAAFENLHGQRTRHSPGANVGHARRTRPKNRNCGEADYDEVCLQVA